MVSARAEAGCLGASTGEEDLSPAWGKNMKNSMKISWLEEGSVTWETEVWQKYGCMSGEIRASGHHVKLPFRRKQSLEAEG